MLHLRSAGAAWSDHPRRRPCRGATGSAAIPNTGLAGSGSAAPFGNGWNVRTSCTLRSPLTQVKASFVRHLAARQVRSPPGAPRRRRRGLTGTTASTSRVGVIDALGLPRPRPPPMRPAPTTMSSSRNGPKTSAACEKQRGRIDDLHDQPVASATASAASSARSPSDAQSSQS